ncbi:ribonuclease H-like domain-containing protein [Tanacetum coccineum]
MTPQDPSWNMDTGASSHLTDNTCKKLFNEYNALITNGTWVLVPRPANVNVVRSMWLFKHKFNANGSLNRYKARLVGNGCSQQQAFDNPHKQNTPENTELPKLGTDGEHIVSADSLNSIPADNVPAGRSSSIPADYVSAGHVLVPADSDRIC